MSRVDQLKAAAVHEMGHAVAHVLGGMEVVSVQAWTTGGWWNTTAGGHVELPKGSDGQPEIEEEQLDDYLVGVLAGQEAEAHRLVLHHRHTVDTARRETAGGCAYDLETFAEFAPLVKADEATVREKARELVVAHWQALDELAERLARQATVPGAEIVTTLGVRC